jgi:hypothetical protein
MSLIKQLLNGEHDLSKKMMEYIATPAPCDCNKTGNCKCYQSHGGDLFQHSQWSALYLTMWLETNYEKEKEKYLHTLLTEIMNSDLLKTVISNDEIERKEFIQLCGFMHDIGKGGDNKTDMYEKNKYIDYDEKYIDDSYHPEVCKLVIIKPSDNLYDGIFKKLLIKLLEKYFSQKKARFILALVAAVHWNFGKLNVENLNYTASNYISDFNAQIDDIKQKLGLELKDFPELFENNTAIKLCMVVSCSDIASGNNKELIGEVNTETNDCDSTENKDIIIDDIKVSKCTHLSNGSKWIDMKTKYEKYILSILKELEELEELEELKKTSQGCFITKFLKKKRKYEKTLKKLRKKHKKTSKKRI